MGGGRPVGTHEAAEGGEGNLRAGTVEARTEIVEVGFRIAFLPGEMAHSTHAATVSEPTIRYSTESRSNTLKFGSRRTLRKSYDAVGPM
jgi:hypothetical protein